MILATALLAAFAVSVLFAGRELARPHTRENRVMCAVATMIILAILAGGALTGGGM